MFNIREGDEVMARGKVHVVYKLDVNEFRGRKSVQMLVEHMQPFMNTLALFFNLWGYS